MSFTDLDPSHSDSISLNFFSPITTDFNISSALRGVIQDQWSSGFVYGDPLEGPITGNESNLMYKVKKLCGFLHDRIVQSYGPDHPNVHACNMHPRQPRLSTLPPL